MKSVLVTLLEFLESRGMKVTSINLSVDIDGRVAYCTGTYENGTLQMSRTESENQYRFMAAKDFRFIETHLEITDSFKFIITKP